MTPWAECSKKRNPTPPIVKACYDDGVTVTMDEVKIGEEGHRKRETRDALGHLVKVEEYADTFSSCTTDPGSPYAATTYQYDVLGNLRFVIDHKSNQTEMHYDTVGRKDYMIDPDMGRWDYTYDANSNLKTQKDAKSQTITFTYDELNRIKKKDYPTGTDVDYIYDETWSTHPKGRLTTMTDASGWTQYYYDKLGRTVKTVKNGGWSKLPR